MNDQDPDPENEDEEHMDAFKEHRVIEVNVTSNAADGATIDINGTELLIKQRSKHVPMVCEIWVNEEEKPIGAINTATKETVCLGGVSELLANQVEDIKELPLEEIPDTIDELAYRLNPAGKEDPEKYTPQHTQPETEDNTNDKQRSINDDREVICLCGSTRFKDAYIEENLRLVREGKMVLSVGLFGHADNIELEDEEKTKLDEQHKRKIDLADRIHVINCNGYIGESTQSEIEYAEETGTEVTYLEEPARTDGGVKTSSEQNTEWIESSTHGFAHPKGWMTNNHLKWDSAVYPGETVDKKTFEKFIDQFEDYKIKSASGKTCFLVKQKESNQGKKDK